MLEYPSLGCAKAEPSQGVANGHLLPQPSIAEVAGHRQVLEH